MSEEGENKGVITKYKLLFLIIPVIFIIVGIILLSYHKDTLGTEHVEDYTDCVDHNIPSSKCKSTLANGNKCICFQNFELTVPIEGIVTAYYQLDTYDQSARGYYDSRDDKQLMGVLSMTPSPKCGSYSYINTTEGSMPIAPCGEIADAMFNDTFNLSRNNKYLKEIFTGLISEEDKAPYHNPEGNLEEAFRNYSKPINWGRNVWQLDTLNASNNGFQNEAFIAWMKIDLKRKPIWRVNNTGEYEHGLPAGNYSLRVEYAYPASRYDGRRKFILSSIHHEVNSVKLALGIIFLIIGVITFIGSTIYINKQVYGKYMQCENVLK